MPCSPPFCQVICIEALKSASGQLGRAFTQECNKMSADVPSHHKASPKTTTLGWGPASLHSNSKRKCSLQAILTQLTSGASAAKKSCAMEAAGKQRLSALPVTCPTTRGKAALGGMLGCNTSGGGRRSKIFQIFCRLHSCRAASAVHRNVALLKPNDLAYTAVRNVLQQGAPPMHASQRIHSPFDHQDLQCRYGQGLPGRPHHAAAGCLYCVLVIMQLSALPHIPRPMLNSKSWRSIETWAVYSSTRTESCFIPSLLLHDMSTAQCLLRRSGCIYASLSSSRVRVPETLCHARGFG